MTLREFIEKVNLHGHYRIYQPNRDCLIFESFRTVHSHYWFDKEHKERGEYFNDAFYNNNLFNDNVRDSSKPLDRETQEFLEEFGDYEIFLMECGGFIPYNILKNNNGEVKIDLLSDRYPNGIDCFNIFIRRKEEVE